MYVYIYIYILYHVLYYCKLYKTLDSTNIYIKTELGMSH